MNGIYDDGAEYGSDRTNDRRERYAAAILEASEFGLAEEDTDRLADAAMAVADAELGKTNPLLTRIAALEHRLSVANLKLTASGLKLQLAEQNLDGMRVTQKSQHDALRAIRVVLDDDEKYDSLYCGELVITINEILKGLEL